MDILNKSKIENYRLLAVQGAELAERKLRDLEEEGRSYALKAYKDASAVDALFYLSAEQLEHEVALMKKMDQLIDHPRDGGRLAGPALLPSSTTLARVHLEKVRDCLQDHIGAVRDLQNYRDLHQKAINAMKLPPSRWPEALEELEHQRHYADVTRKVRAQRSLERNRQPS